MAGKLITGGAGAKKIRRESPLLTEAKEASDGSHAMTNSALSLLQEATNKGAEDIQAFVASPGSVQANKSHAVPTTEVEGVTFPERLMELVMNETDKQALWWLPEGKSFAIHSKRFTKTILAKNFQGSKFESFTRKLARWGFKRLSGPDIPPQTFVFEHPYFQRSRPELAKEISGSKKKAQPTPPSAGERSPPSLGLSRAAAHLAQAVPPSSAPWPTFGDLQPTAETGRVGSGGLYDDMIRQALLQKGLSANSAAVANSVRSDARGNQLQPELENRLLLQSMLNYGTANVAESPARSQRQDALLTATMLAKQERARALAAAANASASPSTGPARSNVDLAPSLTLPNLTATNHLRRSLTSAYPIPSFASDPSPSLPSILQQQQQQHAVLPSPSTTAAAATLDPLVRLYLQQQEASRQENLLLQQEVLRQELRRREQMQRDQQQREWDDRG